MIRSNPSSIKLKLQAATIAIVCFVFAMTTASGGEEHVTGTASRISETAVTVRTATGEFVDVSFDENTTYLRAKRPIQRSSIRAWDKLVIHAVKVKEKLIANTVEVLARSSAPYIRG